LGGASGVRLAQGGTPTGAEAVEDATILLPQGANGPAFLALPNHYVIRRYNNSVSYALAIGLTADGIMGKPGLTKTWPNDPSMTRDQRIGAQRALTQLGYDTQGVDGVIGSNTRAALRRWQIANNRIADGYLTADAGRRTDPQDELRTAVSSPLRGEVARSVAERRRGSATRLRWDFKSPSTPAQGARRSPSPLRGEETVGDQAALSQSRTTLPDWPDFMASKPSR
jgi:peptidoglycan hydrolase-like protein with peptidoglycan-binding domain